MPDRRGLFPPLTLAFLPFVLFAPITAVRRVFSAQDVQAYFFPYHLLPGRIMADGHLPLWNPYAFSGIPLLGDGQTAMFYPPNWLFFLLPAHVALNYAILLQFSIAGVAMYLLARSMDLTRLPAFVSALSYMFCGFLTARVVHLSIMSGAALMPLVLFCLDRLFSVQDGTARRGVKVRWFVATATAVALQALAGHPQIPVYTALAAVVYVVVRGVEQRHVSRGLALLAGAYLLGYSFAAIQLVPWIEFAKLSVRAAGADFGFVFGTSTTGAEWMLLVFPYLLGAPAKSAFTSHQTSIEASVRAWEHSGYVGILPLALAAVAVGYFVELRWSSRVPKSRSEDTAEASTIRRRWYSLLFLFALLVLGVTLAAGRHTRLSEVIYHTPVLGSLRAVERGFVLASFALALTSGFGLQRILEPTWRRGWLLVPATLIAAVPLLYAWGAHLPPGSAGTYVPVLLALLSGGLLVRWSRRPPGIVTLFMAAALVVWDMGLYAVSFNATAGAGMYRYTPQSVGALRGEDELFRKATVIVDTNDLPNRSAQEALAMSWGMVHGIEDVNGFNSLQPRRYTDYVFGPSENEVSYGYLRNPALFQPDNPILNSLNVRYVLLPAGSRMPLGPHLRPVFEDASVRVYENTRVYPRAYFAERVRTERDPGAVLRHVTAAGFDGRREAFIESDTPPPALGGAGLSASCRATRISPNELRVRTLTAEPRFLVVSEMFMSGWRADIDGIDAPVYRTNYLFRGVVVPAGQHVVRFVFRPRSLVYGAAVTVLGFAIAAILLLRVSRP